MMFGGRQCNAMFDVVVNTVESLVQQRDFADAINAVLRSIFAASGDVI